MFCSHCGKSLKPEDEKCPHCGAVVGESRFDGNPPYTGAQEKLRPGKAVRAYGAVYSEENVVRTAQAGKRLPSDSDSDYRAPRQPEQTEETHLFNAEEDTYGDDTREETEKPARKAFGLNFLHRNEAEDAEEPEEAEESKAPEKIGEDGLTDSERAMITADTSFVPTQPTGISEDVSSYMKRLKENEARKKAAREKKRPAPEETDDDLYAESLMKEARAEKPKASKPAKAAMPVKAARPAKIQAPEEPEDEPEEYGDEPETAPKAKKTTLASLKKLHIKLPARHKATDEEDDETGIAPEAADSGDDEFDDFEDESKPKKKKLSLAFLKKKRAPKVKADFEDESADDAEEPVDDDEFTDADYKLDQQRENRFRLIRNVAVAALALVIIVGAIVGVTVVREKSKTAPIETVTLSLWNDGIDLIQSRVQDSYRKKMLALYDKSNPTTYLTLQAAFTTDLDSLDSLMPASPLQNDQVFINALKAIQESINNCLSNDALSMTDTTKTSAEKDQESALRWESVQEIVTTLKNSTNVGQLEAIIKGERVELIQSATATPVPTATPAPYTSLAKGASGLAVTNLQTRLTELGYMTSSIDGDYGNKTKTAVEKFQQAAGLTVTGIADVATQELLYSEEAPSAK